MRGSLECGNYRNTIELPPFVQPIPLTLPKPVPGTELKATMLHETCPPTAYHTLDNGLLNTPIGMSIGWGYCVSISIDAFDRYANLSIDTNCLDQ